jgi:hypothetical protein
MFSGDQGPAASAAQCFFDAARCTFEEAARPAGAERTMLLAGRQRLRIRFGSFALAESVGPVFAHLPEAPSDGMPPDFTIDAWDTASSGIAMPVSPWRNEDYGPYGEIRQAGWPRTLRARFNLHSGVLSMVGGASGAIWWTRDVAALPDYERGAPFALLLHWWQLLCPPPAYAIHAAAVGTGREGGLLLVGRGGSGKSTTALACLAAGFLYAGDDYCLLQSTADGPRAASLFATGKLSSAMLARFPVFAASVVNPARPAAEKALLFLGRSFSANLATDLPVRAILLPRVSAGVAETRLTPASPAAALQALAPSTIFLFPRIGREAGILLAQLAGVTRRLPCFHLELAADADASGTPEILSGLLGRLHAGSLRAS